MRIPIIKYSKETFELIKKELCDKLAFSERVGMDESYCVLIKDKQNENKYVITNLSITEIRRTYYYKLVLDVKEYINEVLKYLDGMNNNDDSTVFKVIPPDGMELYLDGNSIKFRKISNDNLSYEDISEMLFLNKKCYYFGDYSSISEWNPSTRDNCTYSNICNTKEQGEKILIINKLLNLSNYFNSKHPNVNGNHYFYLYMNDSGKVGVTFSVRGINSSIIKFNSKEDAELSIKIIGEDKIKLIFK